MDQNKLDLVILSDNYPLSAGEFFLEREMEYLSNSFETIYVICGTRSDVNTKRQIPSNCNVIYRSAKLTFFDKIFSLKGLLNKHFRDEIICIKSKLAINNIFQILKVSLIELKKAQVLRAYLKDMIVNRGLSHELILYSYWHDYKALALALLKENDDKYLCIARAHGWDTFPERQKSSYLPFKTFIINSLNRTFTISTAGRTALMKQVAGNDGSNIEIARLGSINNSTTVLEKKTKGYVICSCSSMIELKRIHLLIHALSIIELENIRWVHFGDGPMSKELNKLADGCLNSVEFEFRGLVSNNEVISFYNENFVDLFVNVSEYEGVPVSIMEAQSAGIPVIATNVGGTFEIVNNINGRLVDKNISPKELADHVLELLLDVDGTRTRRSESYLNWKINYDGNENYTKFIARLNEMYFTS